MNTVCKNNSKNKVLSNGRLCISISIKHSELLHMMNTTNLPLNNSNCLLFNQEVAAIELRDIKMAQISTTGLVNIRRVGHGSNKQ